MPITLNLISRHCSVSMLLTIASTKIPKYQYVGYNLLILTRCRKRSAGDWIGGSNGSTAPSDCAATDAEQRQRLLEISRARTEPTNRVDRARIILVYLQNPSAYAVARTIRVTQH